MTKKCVIGEQSSGAAGDRCFFRERACVYGGFAVPYRGTFRKDVFQYMIKVDISNVWGQLTLADLLAMEKEVSDAHATLMDGTGEGNDFLG